MADLEGYDDIMKIAFQAEEAIDAGVIRRFGREYPDKTILIREGDVDQRIFWILSGTVYITRRVDNKYKVLATVREGELIGEMSFFDRSVRSATVIAKGPVKALVLSRENFTDIFTASPQWSRRLLAALAGRIRTMIEKLSAF